MGTSLRTVEIFFNMVWSEQQWARVWKSMYTVRTLAGASFLSQVRKVLKLKRVPKLENILKRQECTKAVFKTKSFPQRFAKECYCYCEIVRSSFWKTCNSEKLKVTGSQNPKHPGIDIYIYGGNVIWQRQGFYKNKVLSSCSSIRTRAKVGKEICSQNKVLSSRIRTRAKVGTVRRSRGAEWERGLLTFSLFSSCVLATFSNLCVSDAYLVNEWLESGSGILAIGWQWHTVVHIGHD